MVSEKFIDFLARLENDDNRALIRAIRKGYLTVCKETEHTEKWQDAGDGAKLTWCSFEQAQGVAKHNSGLKAIDDSVSKALTNPPFDGSEFLMATCDGHLCGMLQCGMRAGKEYGVGKPMPFVYELGTGYDTKGYANLLVDEFVRKYGDSFWLFCLDDDAEKFWNRACNNRGIPVRQAVGKDGKPMVTSWGGHILLAGDGFAQE